MKMDNSITKFPTSLPNDIEDYLIFFPRKFPKIVAEYEELAKKYLKDPEGLDNYCQTLVKELWQGYSRIKKDYKNVSEKDRSPAFLLSIDLRLQKLNCFRFWIINYALCEGPIHKYYAYLLLDLVEKFVKDNDIETEIIKREKVERILMRGDYKDLYLTNALKGIEVYEDLKSYEKTKDLFFELERLVLEKNDKESYKIIDQIIKNSLNDKDNPKLKRFLDNMKDPLSASRVKSDLSVVYVTIIGAIEFYEKNIELKAEFESISEEINIIFLDAKELLNEEDLNNLKLSYEMLLKFKKFKDDFGDIDPEWLPFWFAELLPELEQKINAPKGSCVMGQGSTFYSFPWYFNKDLIKRVYTIDYTDFDVNTA